MRSAEEMQRAAQANLLLGALSDVLAFDTGGESFPITSVAVAFEAEGPSDLTIAGVYSFAGLELMAPIDGARLLIQAASALLAAGAAERGENTGPMPGDPAEGEGEAGFPWDG
jgi:hypothetical protein